MMGSTVRTFLPILLIMGLFTACEEEVDWHFQAENNGTLVVEAILTNQRKIQQVRLSSSFSDINSPPMPVDDATVWITDGADQVEFRKTVVVKGLYVSKLPFAAGKDREYTIHILWNGVEYEATAKLSFVAPLEDITFEETEDGDSLMIKQIGPVYHPLQQAMYEILIDELPINPFSTQDARLFYYTFSTIDASQLFLPSQEKFAFPKESLVIVHKYGLDSGFADFLRSLVMETQWQGGFFDEASASLNSNISNGALGYFSVCAVVSDTLIAR